MEISIIGGAGEEERYPIELFISYAGSQLIKRCANGVLALLNILLQEWEIW